MFIQVYEQINNHVTNTMSAYVRFHSGLEDLVRMQKIPYVGALRERKDKNTIRWELEEFLNQIK